ncbi:hypothetical protein [Sulfobacillus harzensis]|uniref:Uncharacterized protein n=1 Tax=Sulfobacillus harzensis TaxID=2729629 RepID=A0A7Y0L446_9FIRM|nr:hypothetical protein [Sulfobacillus harzensis]NMP22050.1 hypothetical protein [Sulfobacillus harzensis]
MRTRQNSWERLREQTVTQLVAAALAEDREAFRQLWWNWCCIQETEALMARWLRSPDSAAAPHHVRRCNDSS